MISFGRKTWIITILIISSFIFSSQSKDERQDLWGKDYLTKEETMEIIYLFEDAINSKSNPTVCDVDKLFSYEREIRFEVEYCEKKGWIPAETHPKCREWASNRFDKCDENDSLLFKFLRSSNGSFFENDKNDNINIYIYWNYKIDKSVYKGDVLHGTTPIKTLISLDDNKILPCVFHIRKTKPLVQQFGAISSFECLGKFYP